MSVKGLGSRISHLFSDAARLGILFLNRGYLGDEPFLFRGLLLFFPLRRFRLNPRPGAYTVVGQIIYREYFGRIYMVRTYIETI
jgi:hypothetical protein